MTFLSESTRSHGVRRTLIAGAIGAVALGATAAPALADVLGYYYAQPATVNAPAPTYTYTYTYTEPTTTYAAPAPAPAGTTTTTTTTTYNSEVTANSVVTAPTAPPLPRVELIPPSPGPQMVWQSGHWSFNGAAWDWVPGHYEAAPQPTAQWIPGHWTQQPGGSWLWIAGRWTS
jgi:WXXGXW repeat (2 copies)